jgi:hypothetical protein
MIFRSEVKKAPLRDTRDALCRRPRGMGGMGGMDY